MNQLHGKVAYITGGSKGIGKGIAEVLLDKGVRVAITGTSQQSVDEALQVLTPQYGDQVLGIVSDVRSHADEDKAVKEVLAKWSGLDFVIANAGVGHFASIEDLTYDQWKSVIDINLTGVFNTTKATIPYLKQSKGYLITIASLAGTNFFATGSAYNASKFGLVGFTQAVMLDVRKHGIKVTTVMPGSVATHFNNHEPSEADAWKIQPEDIGKIVFDLLTMHPRTLPSKVEVRPAIPGGK